MFEFVTNVFQNSKLIFLHRNVIGNYMKMETEKIYLDDYFFHEIDARYGLSFFDNSISTPKSKNSKNK